MLYRDLPDTYYGTQYREIEDSPKRNYAIMQIQQRGASETTVPPEQPLPTPGGESVTRALMKLLEEREAKGIATYGRSLETFNGRDAPRDCVEELIDAAQYALQWAIERAWLIEKVAALGKQIERVTYHHHDRYEFDECRPCREARMAAGLPIYDY